MMNDEINDKNMILDLIPHSGSMCLIDKVVSWDDLNITCYSDTHKDITNPLRNSEILPMSSLIEYGAQAMAIHGGLLAKKSGDKIKEGYLAALREVKMVSGDASKINSALCIEATQKMASQGNMIYSFSVKENNKVLVSGRATVVAVFND